MPENNHRQMPSDSLPWYRYGWPWFLISIPFISVMLGCVMLYLALQANNSLVVDDYYKQGKAINLRIERDRAASLLGLGASVSPASEGLIVELYAGVPASLPDSLQQQAASLAEVFSFPPNLTINWIHVTQQEHDGSALAQSIGAGKYIAPGVSLPESAKFRLHVQPDDDQGWRLVGPLQEFSIGKSFTIDAPSVDQLFNSTMMRQHTLKVSRRH